jgi:alpha-ketoglutarate-dependent taurine dioxygenase
MNPISSTGQRRVELPSALHITPTGAALGAQVTGVDLRELAPGKADDRVFAAIVAAWLEHRVLLFRDQRLSTAQLIAFSRRFGDLDHAPIQENGRRFVEGYPELYVVSNVVERGVSIGSLGAGEATWHTDMSYLPMPPKASLLYALEVPEAGGDTYFCDMYGAYEALPPALRRSIGTRQIKHDGTYNSGGYVREGVSPTDDPRAAPGELHPLVCAHPETGRRCLYLGRRRNAYIEGLPLDASERLLNELWSRATEEALTWRHRWRVGDLVLWDNRCTMHRRDSFDPAERRVMHRTQIKSETPPTAAAPS